MDKLAAELGKQAAASVQLRQWYLRLSDRHGSKRAGRVLRAAVAVFAPDSITRLRRNVRATIAARPTAYDSVSAARSAACALEAVTLRCEWWCDLLSVPYRGWIDRAVQHARVLCTSVEEQRWRRIRVLVAGTRQRDCVLALLPPDLWPRTLRVCNTRNEPTP